MPRRCRCSGLGQGPGDEPFQVQRLVLPGEEADEIRLRAQIAGNNGRKINIRVFIRDVHQGQAHKLRITNNDVCPLRDHLFGVGN